MVFVVIVKGQSLWPDTGPQYPNQALGPWDYSVGQVAEISPSFMYSSFVSLFICICLHRASSMRGTAKFVVVSVVIGKTKADFQEDWSVLMAFRLWAENCPQFSWTANKFGKTFCWPQELNKDDFPQVAYFDSSKFNDFSKINKNWVSRFLRGQFWLFLSHCLSFCDR